MLELRTGCRLHFGLMELAPNQPLRYGGLGLMIHEPSLQLRVRMPGQSATSHSPVVDIEIQRRAQLALEHALSVIELAEPGVRRSGESEMAIDILQHPQLHSGFGCGTQLAASVAAAAWLALYRRSMANGAASAQPGQVLAGGLTLERLATLSGRGKRSGIGLHGFLHGGLIQDLGHAQFPKSTSPSTLEPAIGGTTVSRSLTTRSTRFPEQWSIVLLTASPTAGMCGSEEEQLIERAGKSPNPHRDEMLALSHTVMQAAQAQDFAAFTQALDRYMILAGQLFSSVQAGRYRDASVAQRVDLAQRTGLLAVGQSSWGPTVFGFAPSPTNAEQIAERLRASLLSSDVQVTVARAANHGATWQSSSSGVQHAS